MTKNRNFQLRANANDIEVGFVQSDMPQCYIQTRSKERCLVLELEELKILAYLINRLMNGLQQESDNE